jgi:hypothetical protein
MRNKQHRSWALSEVSEQGWESQISPSQHMFLPIGTEH